MTKDPVYRYGGDSARDGGIDSRRNGGEIREENHGFEAKTKRGSGGIGGRIRARKKRVEEENGGTNQPSDGGIRRRTQDGEKWGWGS